MEEEKKICKTCKKHLCDDEMQIYNGYCEKCYNKWINEKIEYKPPDDQDDYNSDDEFPKTVRNIIFAATCSLLLILFIIILIFLGRVSLLSIAALIFGTIFLGMGLNINEFLVEIAFIPNFFYVLFIITIVLAVIAINLWIRVFKRTKKIRRNK